MIRDIERARQLYAPNIEVMTSNLVDMGTSLDTACHELSGDLTLDRLDRLSAKLNAAQTTIQHLRKSMLASGVHGAGTG